MSFLRIVDLPLGWTVVVDTAAWAVIGVGVGYGLHRAYHWKPETDGQELLRIAALLVGSAYLLHLAADLFTARSIPVLGR